MANVRIDELNGTALPSSQHVFPAMKDGVTVKLTVQQVSDLVRAVILDGTPAALDTLNELAAALGDDANYAATITAALGEKLVKSQSLADLPDKQLARVNLGVPAIVSIQTVTSAVSAVDISLPSGYNFFSLKAMGVKCSDVAGVTLRGRFSADGGGSFYTAAENYRWASIITNPGGTNGVIGQMNSVDDSMIMANNLYGDFTSDFQSEISVQANPSVVSNTAVYGPTSGMITHQYASKLLVAGSVNLLRLFPSAGTITAGKFVLIGG